MDTEVLIVGAGPTGLMLADQLARRGVRPMIIDRHSGPAQQSRAMAVQARTLEIYSAMGIAERAVERGKEGVGANMWANGKLTARVPIGDIGQDLSPFPYVLMLGQDENELILGGKLQELGFSVQWNTELTNLEQHADHVTAQLKGPDGITRTITAAWVAGCDGAHSPVRELNGITFPGAPYEHVFFVADTVATGDMVQDELNVYLLKKGFHLFFPMRTTNGWRVIGILPANLRDRPDLSFDDVVPHLQQEAGTRLRFQTCHWFSTYRIHHRRAQRFRDHRCFLLGDAAHVHSPMGAQGMNTGLQDAYNLAWKLAMVVKGEADETLLDSYESERIPVAQRLLSTTDRAFRLVVADTWLAAFFRTKIMAKLASIAMRRERVRRVAFRTISQIGIQYRDSALSKTLPGIPATAPAGGDRFPWIRLRLSDDGPAEDLTTGRDDTRFGLLLFGQTPQVSTELGDLVRACAVPGTPANQAELAKANIPEQSFYLLRPDGHVAIAGVRFDKAVVLQYFADHGMASRPIMPPHAGAASVTGTGAAERLAL